jgi:carboxyl-terminal processing protease
MAMLRGSSGEIDLTVRRDNRQIQMQVPQRVWVEQAVESHSFDAGKQQLGYIGVRLFTSDSGEQVREAVNALTAHGIGKCIIDLRNNPGGYLDAMAVAGSAFTDQTLGWKVRRDGTKEPIHATAEPFKPMQLVVLVNEGTASAAEVLAAGLRDTTGARLVGAKTYGRGQIQTYVALNEGAGIVIPAASAESVKAVRFNKGSAFPRCFCFLHPRNAGRRRGLSESCCIADTWLKRQDHDHARGFFLVLARNAKTHTKPHEGVE